MFIPIFKKDRTVKVKNSKEQGNALFLVLIAVVLFAALSYAVVRSGRLGGNTAEDEKISMEIAPLLQYATLIENAIVRLRVSHHCEETEISFYMPDNPALAAYKHTPESPDECKVFHPDGGGMSYQKPPAGINDGSGFNFSAVTVISIGTGNQDLVLNLLHIDRNVCLAINEKMDVSLYNGDLPDTSGVNTPFTGTYNDSGSGSVIGGGGAPAGPVVGKYSGCFEHLSSGLYWYYHVLMPR